MIRLDQIAGLPTAANLRHNFFLFCTFFFLSFWRDTLTYVLSAFVRRSPGKDQAAIYKSTAHRAVSAEACPAVLPLLHQKKRERVRKKKKLRFFFDVAAAPRCCWGAMPLKPFFFLSSFFSPSPPPVSPADISQESA